MTKTMINYPDIITIHPILLEDGTKITEKKIYPIEQWMKNIIDSTINQNKKNVGFEGEGFFVNNDGNPIVFYNGQWLNIKELNPEKIKEISQNFSDENLMNTFKKKNNSFDKYANTNGELDLTTNEIGFRQGYTIKEIFNKIIETYKDLNQYYEKGIKYLPYGNLPIETPNLTNLSNSYYKHIFDERDGYDGIADFRGAGLQFHKEMDNYELSVYIFNKIRHILPVFQVLSQNSPFKNSTYNGNLSERTATKYYWKMTGIPNSIDNNFINQLQEWLDTSINTVTPYYYAVRFPRVDIKTIENCAMDTVSDLPLLFGLLDFYYRITEKLKQSFITGEKLPKNIFGNDTSDFIETSILQENYNKSIRNGTKTEYNILGKGREKTEFKEFVENIFDFIEDIPSQFPKELALKFGINSGDPTQEILLDIAKNGNLAENTIKDFGINTKPGIITEIQENDVKQHILEVTKNFQNQLNKI